MKKNLVISALLAAFVALVALSSCSQAPAPREPYTALDAYELADMSGYDCAAGYEKDYQFVNMTVAEVAAEMDAGTSFVLYTGYNKCPWCNVILNHLNDIALERGIKIAYIDTRRDPSWKSNVDIDDYDLFIERFGSTLKLDEADKPHLYVPHIFFVKDGQLVSDYSGTVPSQENPDDTLSDEEINEFLSAIKSNIDRLGI